jgi:hypothetical protein
MISIQIPYNNIRATVENSTFRSADAEFARTLNLLRLPPGYHPNRDLALAQLAVRHFGGTVQQPKKKETEPKLVGSRDLQYPDGTVRKFRTLAHRARYLKIVAEKRPQKVVVY